MNPINLNDLNDWVNANIGTFHQNRIDKVNSLKLNALLKKNPYLFKAKNATTANELVVGFLDAFLSSSEEKMFGDFLEQLAIEVARTTCNGIKSAGTGIDIDFIEGGVRYVVSIKSGTNWGNSTQHKGLAQAFRDAINVIKQTNQRANVQAVLGICYGKTKTVNHKEGYLKVVGQNFWYLISGSRDLYTQIVKPIGYRAKEHNEVFLNAKNALINRVTGEFVVRFCDASGNIDWDKLVKYNSGNYDGATPKVPTPKKPKVKKPKAAKKPRKKS